MENLSFSYQNILNGNGFDIAVTGMLIVFAALAIISLFIASLPKVIGILDKIFPEIHHHAPATSKKPERDNDALLAAIGYALYKVRAKNGIKE